MSSYKGLVKLENKKDTNVLELIEKTRNEVRVELNSVMTRRELVPKLIEKLLFLSLSNVDINFAGVQIMQCLAVSTGQDKIHCYNIATMCCHDNDVAFLLLNQIKKDLDSDSKGIQLAALNALSYIMTAEVVSDIIQDLCKRATPCNDLTQPILGTLLSAALTDSSTVYQSVEVIKAIVGNKTEYPNEIIETAIAVFSELCAIEPTACLTSIPVVYGILAETPSLNIIYSSIKAFNNLAKQEPRLILKLAPFLLDKLTRSGSSELVLYLCDGLVSMLSNNRVYQAPIDQELAVVTMSSKLLNILETDANKNTRKAINMKLECIQSIGKVIEYAMDLFNVTKSQQIQTAVMSLQAPLLVALSDPNITMRSASLRALIPLINKQNIKVISQEVLASAYGNKEKFVQELTERTMAEAATPEEGQKTLEKLKSRMTTNPRDLVVYRTESVISMLKAVMSKKVETQEGTKYSYSNVPDYPWLISTLNLIIKESKWDIIAELSEAVVEDIDDYSCELTQISSLLARILLDIGTLINKTSVKGKVADICGMIIIQFYSKVYQQPSCISTANISVYRTNSLLPVCISLYSAYYEHSFDSFASDVLFVVIDGIARGAAQRFKIRCAQFDNSDIDTLTDDVGSTFTENDPRANVASYSPQSLNYLFCDENPRRKDLVLAVLDHIIVLTSKAFGMLEKDVNELSASPLSKQEDVDQDLVEETVALVTDSASLLHQVSFILNVFLSDRCPEVAARAQGVLTEWQSHLRSDLSYQQRTTLKRYIYDEYVKALSTKEGRKSSTDGMTVTAVRELIKTATDVLSSLYYKSFARPAPSQLLNKRTIASTNEMKTNLIHNIRQAIGILDADNDPVLANGRAQNEALLRQILEPNAVTFQAPKEIEKPQQTLPVMQPQPVAVPQVQVVQQPVSRLAQSFSMLGAPQQETPQETNDEEHHRRTNEPRQQMGFSFDF